MSRLQKKCFIGVTSMHVLLFVVLIVGPGFFSKDETMDESQVLTVFPDVITDSLNKSGGETRSNPTQDPPKQAVQNPPPAAPPQNPVREPDPPKQVEKVVEREKPTPRDNRDSLDAKPEKPQKHEVKVNRNVVKISQVQPKTSSTTSQDNSAQEQKEREQFAKAIAKTGNRVKDSLSSSTDVSMPEGLGGGGVSYASYAQVVRARYTAAWTIPNDVTDDEAIVKVSVTIARDGSVISSRIITESGSKLVDRSIQNALDRVTTIGVAFPVGAKESQRTFTISFSLKAKKLLG